MRGARWPGMTRLSLTLALLLSIPALAQADAPVRAPTLTLDADYLAQREATIATRASSASALKGVGITGFVVGGAAGTAFVVGTVVSAINGLGRALTWLVVAPYLGGGGYAEPREPDFTPLLGTAIAGLAVGLVSTVAGVALRHSGEHLRDELEREQQDAAEQQRAAFWARMDAEAARIPPLAQPGPEAAPESPTPPPPPPDAEAPRRPLVKR